MQKVTEDVQKLSNALDPMDRKIDKLTNAMQKVTENVQKLSNALDPMDRKIDKLTNGMQNLTEDVQNLSKSQEHIRRISAIVGFNILLYRNFFKNLIHTQLFNRSQGSGDETALEVVLFENGDNPTKPPVRSYAFTKFFN
jgi:predicted RNase H-like nuclease (RuvC/YqgF family)